ncbi:MAG: prepilin-type N-terminal cleavage/methylation domain-containing protein [Thermodesulfobacteriota bacterium]
MNGEFKFLKKSKGFTLIEIIIVIVILSIVSAITIYFITSSVKHYVIIVNQKSLLDEGKLALERMCRDLRDAQSIAFPPYGNSSNRIVFQRCHATFGDLANETISFRLNGTTLEKVKNSPYGIHPMVSNVSSFSVIRGAAGNEEITLSLSLSLTTGEQIFLQTKVYPKNLIRSSIYKNFFGNWQEEISS